MSGVLFSVPFILLLGCIAMAPALPHPYSTKWENSHWAKAAIILPLMLASASYYMLFSPPTLIGGTLRTAGLALLGSTLGELLLHDYFPFIILLASLFVISSGIRLTGNIPATPAVNTSILAVGAVCANLLGTTGASMVLIRPLLQINAEREYRSHTVVFFIFLVSNIGGSLTPMGDPPLFLGYIRGVPFLWTLTSLWKPWLVSVCYLLVLYFLIDRFWRYPKESSQAHLQDVRARSPFRIQGYPNLVFLAVVAFIVATVRAGEPWLFTSLRPPLYAREALLVLLTAASYVTTDLELRRSNTFSFAPIVEVAILFAGIFITMSIPLSLLPGLAARLGLSQPWQFFWITGAFSSVLDNAPTYAIYCTLGQSVPLVPGTASLSLLGGPISESILTAVSLGAVYMGAITYIGNAPNLMVRAIARDAFNSSRAISNPTHVLQRDTLPGFLRYVGLSAAVLLPLFGVITFLFL